MTTHDDNWRKANELGDELRDLRGTGARANLIFEALQEARREERERSAQKLELLVLTALRNPHLMVSEVEELVEGLIEGLRSGE